MKDYFFRKTALSDWILIPQRDIPADLISAVDTGKTMHDRHGQYRSLPRLATSTDIIAAAAALSLEITKARLNGDWNHPATQLLIEKAHDDFRSASGETPKPLPPIVIDPQARRRWKPLRCW